MYVKFVQLVTELLSKYFLKYFLKTKLLGMLKTTATANITPQKHFKNLLARILTLLLEGPARIYYFQKELVVS